jgi:adenylate/nucleoside-diphosphate kinase
LGRNAQEMLLRGEAIPPSMVAQMIDNKINSPEVMHHGYVVDGFPTHSEDGLDINQQMNMLNNWKLQPDFIVNLRVSFMVFEEP